LLIAGACKVTEAGSNCSRLDVFKTAQPQGQRHIDAAADGHPQSTLLSVIE
jgi:hypothetical protein